MLDRQRFAADSARALQRADYPQLVRLCRAARQLDPGFADAWFLESVAAEAGRDVAAALRLVDEALSRDAENSEYLVQKARYHVQVSQFEEARESALKALQIGVEKPLQLDSLGVVLTRLGDYERAASVLRRAVAAQPGQPQFNFNLAAAEQFLGNNAAAREHYEAVLRLAPGHARSYWALSELEKNAVSARHETVMRRLMQRPGISSVDELYLAHALARIEEERGNFAEAIAGLARAKARRRRELNYAFDEDLALFQQVRETAPADIPASVDAQIAPIFVLGLPRTGTTLIESILAAHESVESFGELQALPNTIKRLSGDRGPRVMSGAVLRAFAASDGDLSTAYMGEVSRLAGGAAKLPARFVDKTPLNFFYLGFVLQRMPAARVVLLRRHPMDAGLSNFRQLFALEYSYYNYAYDLADTGRYVAAFESLVRFFEQRYPRRFLSVSYEALVGNPEVEVRELLRSLDLPWDPSCLRFHERRGGVATPSTAQVREPIYTDALQRWRRYGDALAPLANALADAGVDIS